MADWIADCTALADAAFEAADDAVFWKNVRATVFLNMHDVPTAEEEALPQLIRDRIAAFAAPSDPANIYSMVQSLQAASREVHKNKDDALGNIKDPLMNEWEGSAAKNFEIYIGKMSAAVENHSDILNALALVTDAYRTLVEGMQKELSRFVRTSIDAIDARAISPGKIGEEIVDVVSTVIDIKKASTVMDRVIGALKAGAQEAADYAGADDGMDVLRQVAMALRLMRELIEGEVKRLAAAYRAVGEEISEDLASVNPKMPTIASKNFFDPNDFGLLASPKFERDKAKVSTDPLIKPKPGGLGAERSPQPA